MDNWHCALVLKIAAAHGIKLIDYRRPDASGILCSSGAGLMMGIMDACGGFRFAVDFDGCQGGDWQRWLPWMAKLYPVGVAGWFSITIPDRLRDAVAKCPTDVLVYTQCAVFRAGTVCGSLAEFIRSANSERWLLRRGESRSIDDRFRKPLPRRLKSGNPSSERFSDSRSEIELDHIRGQLNGASSRVLSHDIQRFSPLELSGRTTRDGE